MEEEDGGDPVAVDAGEMGALSFRHFHEAEDERQEQPDDNGASDKAPFFADGAENEVRALLGDKVVFGLGAFEEAFPGESAGADGNFGLVDVVACAGGVVFDAEEVVDAVFLVGLQLFKSGVYADAGTDAYPRRQEDEEDAFHFALVDEKDAGERGEGINRQEQTEVGNLPVQPHFQPFEQGEGEGDEKEEAVELPAVLAIVEESD